MISVLSMCLKVIKNVRIISIKKGVEKMKVRLGEVQELSLLNQLLKEAAERLKRKGSTQWGDVLENNELNSLKNRLIQQEVLVFEENNQIMGMCYLYQKPNDWDFGLWGKKEEKGHYYLHKVAIRDEFVGKNYGEELLDATIMWVQERKGYSILLDCKADVAYLNNFYQKQGFTFVKRCLAGTFDELFADFNLYEYLIQQN